MKKGLLIALLLFVVAVVLAAAALPFVVPPKVENVLRERLMEFGVRTEAKMNLGYRWRSGPALVGDLEVEVPGAPWRVRSDFSVSFGGLAVSVHMNETAFSQDDPVLRGFLEQHPPKGVTNLNFSGSVALDASATASLLRPLPQWNVRVPLRDLSASAVSNERLLALDSLSLTVAAAGIADHLDVNPLRLRAKSVSFDDLALTDLRANLIVDEKSLLLTDASAGFCGGTASLYALRLNVENLSTGFTLLLDDVEAGEALAHLRGFSGSASGRLHGKARLFVRKGGEALRIREAFLYSVPGETGKIRLKNRDEFSENLALVGLDSDTSRNLSDALTDLDYSVLRLDVSRGEGNDATLTTRVAGTATRKGLAVPVDVTVNLHGELEQLVNRGLEYNSKLKGKQP